MSQEERRASERPLACSTNPTGIHTPGEHPSPAPPREHPSLALPREHPRLAPPRGTPKPCPTPGNTPATPLPGEQPCPATGRTPYRDTLLLFLLPLPGEHPSPAPGAPMPNRPHPQTRKDPVPIPGSSPDPPQGEPQPLPLGAPQTPPRRESPRGEITCPPRGSPRLSPPSPSLAPGRLTTWTDHSAIIILVWFCWKTCATASTCNNTPGPPRTILDTYQHVFIK